MPDRALVGGRGHVLDRVGSAIVGGGREVDADAMTVDEPRCWLSYELGSSIGAGYAVCFSRSHGAVCST